MHSKNAWPACSTPRQWQKSPLQAAPSSHAGRTAEMNRCIMSINRHLRTQAHTAGSFGRRVTVVKKILGIRLSSVLPSSLLSPQRYCNVCLITTLCYLCITLQATFAPYQHAHVASFSVQQDRLILEAKKESMPRHGLGK